MGEIVVVTGPPGCVAPALAQHLAERLNPSVLVTGDLFAGLWRRGAIPRWLPEAAPQLAVSQTAAAAAAGTFARTDCTVVFEGVVRPRDLPRFVAAAGRPVTHYLVLLPDVEACVERMRSNAFTSEEEVRALHTAFAVEGLDRYVVGEDGTAEDELAARVLAAVAAGDLLVPEQAGAA